MINIGWRIDWRTFTIVLTILAGATGHVLSSLKETTPYFNDLSSISGNRQGRGEAGNASRDRYRYFRIAYRTALTASEDDQRLSSLSDLFASGSDLQAKTKEGNRAIKAFSQVIQITPDEDGAWSNLAWLYAVSGDLTKAISTEETAIALYRYDYTYYVLLGVFCERAHRSDDAKMAYVHALLLYPRLATSQFWTDLDVRNAQLASASLSSAFTSIDDDDGTNYREVKARLLLANGHLDNANEIAVHDIARVPNLSGVWELEGELSEKRGDYEDSILDYRRAIFLDREDPLPHERLAALELNISAIDIARNQALIAWRLSQHPQSPGAARRRVEYQSDAGPRNGVLPATLLADLEPRFAFGPTFARLAAEYQARGQRKRAEEMDRMANWASSARVLPLAQDDLGR